MVLKYLFLSMHKAIVYLLVSIYLFVSRHKVIMHFMQRRIHARMKSYIHRHRRTKYACILEINVSSNTIKPIEQHQLMLFSDFLKFDFIMQLAPYFSNNSKKSSLSLLYSACMLTRILQLFMQ